jgi:hypothetical protein
MRSSNFIQEHIVRQKRNCVSMDTLSIKVRKLLLAHLFKKTVKKIFWQCISLFEAEVSLWYSWCGQVLV